MKDERVEGFSDLRSIIVEDLERAGDGRQLEGGSVMAIFEIKNLSWLFISGIM